MPQHPRGPFTPREPDELITEGITPELSPREVENSVVMGGGSVRGDNSVEWVTKCCDRKGKISTEVVENPVKNRRF